MFSPEPWTQETLSKETKLRIYLDFLVSPFSSILWNEIKVSSNLIFWQSQKFRRFMNYISWNPSPSIFFHFHLFLYFVKVWLLLFFCNSLSFSLLFQCWLLSLFLSFFIFFFAFSGLTSVFFLSFFIFYFPFSLGLLPFFFQSLSFLRFSVIFYLFLCFFFRANFCLF